MIIGTSWGPGYFTDWDNLWIWSCLGIIWPVQTRKELVQSICVTPVVYFWMKQFKLAVDISTVAVAFLIYKSNLCGKCSYVYIEDIRWPLGDKKFLFSYSFWNIFNTSWRREIRISKRSCNVLSIKKAPVKYLTVLLSLGKARFIM